MRGRVETKQRLRALRICEGKEMKKEDEFWSEGSFAQTMIPAEMKKKISSQ